MKKKILLLMGIFSIGISCAQVGINTLNPEAVLDIRSTGSTTSTKALIVKNNTGTEIFSVRDDGRIITAGVITPSVLLDLRDGTDNSIVAVGQSNQTGAIAGGGALKYDTSAKSLYLSDGINWNVLASDYIKAFVVADITNASQNFANNTTNTISNWTIVSDQTNSFNPLSGIFTAKRSSVYSVSLNITLDDGAVNARTQLQASIKASGGQEVKCITTFNTAGTLPTGVQCSGNFNLALNETLSTSLWHNLGSTKNIKVEYNNLTIVEL
ncbi:hypothetical protein [Dysgonomonas macrotermitis]|uniref:Uncharacterized protein n=1 Tax=Dysgonomonas macrotermitis TaxID=1346286 RepID=A0A1M4ZFM6_9BACT|nr:hypothetical protein [Dysgonomonas macrotermitis]SHF16785.1 hypothetical protein SAMN05444362_10475 [Dysgonomonas macrotermitis]